MRTPRAVWEGCADDNRWIDDQAAMITEIAREFFAAGFAAGAEVAAAGVDAHANGLAANLVVRIPGSVAAGMVSLGARLRELGVDDRAMQNAWRSAVALGPRLDHARRQG